jgi:hypothetical protein
MWVLKYWASTFRMLTSHLLRTNERLTMVLGALRLRSIKPWHMTQSVCHQSWPCCASHGSVLTVGNYSHFQISPTRPHSPSWKPPTPDMGVCCQSAYPISGHPLLSVSSERGTANWLPSSRILVLLQWWVVRSLHQKRQKPRLYHSFEPLFHFIWYNLWVQQFLFLRRSTLNYAGPII